MATEGSAKTKSREGGEARSAAPAAAARAQPKKSQDVLRSADNQALQSLISLGSPGTPKVHEGSAADTVLNSVGATGAAIGQNILLSRNLSGSARQSVLRHELRHVEQVGGRDVDTSLPISVGPRGDVWERQATGSGGTSTGADPQVLRRNDDELMTSIEDSGVCELEPEPGNEGDGTDLEGDEGGVCLDPTRIDVRPLSNRDLVAKGVEVRGYFEGAEVCSDEITAWRQLNAEIEDERQRRVAAGYVFMSTARDAMPENILELVPGDEPGVTQVFVADPDVAFGFADGNLNGVVMTVEQFNAYIQSSGIFTLEDEAAQRVMQILESGAEGNFEAEFPPQPVTLDVDQPVTARSALFRNRLANWDMAADPSIARQNQNKIAGLAGEAFFHRSRQMGYGLLSDPYNGIDWFDVSGRRHSDNAPVFDFGARQLFGPTRRVSVGVSTQGDSGAVNYGMIKLADVLDLPGRQREISMQGASSPQAAIDHIVAMSGDASLQPNSDAFADAQRRFLPDLFFAVPDAQVGDLRAEFATPNASQTEGGRRPLASPTSRAIYDQILRNEPISGIDTNGQPVEITSAHQLNQLLGQPTTASATETAVDVGATRLSESSAADVLTQLGNRAQATIISQANSDGFLMSADALRGVTSASDPNRTRVVQINRTSASSRRGAMRDAIDAHRGVEGANNTQFRDRTSIHGGDNFLSAIRLHSNDQSIERLTDSFTDRRTSEIQIGDVAVTSDVRPLLVEHILTSNSERAVLARDVILTEIVNNNPDITLAEAVDVMVRGIDGTDRPLIADTQGYFVDLINTHGVDRAIQLQSADAMTYAQHQGVGGRTRLMANSARTNLRANAAGYLFTGALEYGVNGRIVLPDGEQVVYDLGASMIQEGAERGLGMGATRLIGTGGGRFATGMVRMGPGMVVAPAWELGVNEIHLSRRRERLAEIGEELPDGMVRASRTRAAGIGLAGAGGGALGMGLVWAAGGSAFGPVGTAVGFIFGLGAAWAASNYTSDPTVEYEQQRIDEYRRRREAQLENDRQVLAGERPVSTIEGGQIPLPVGPSDLLSMQEQQIIAQWFMANARGDFHQPPVDFAPFGTAADHMCLIPELANEQYGPYRDGYRFGVGP